MCVECKGINFPTGDKYCGICELHKPYVSFHMDGYMSDGYRSQCKRCVKRRNTRTPELAETLRQRARDWTRDNEFDPNNRPPKRTEQQYKGKPSQSLLREMRKDPRHDLRGDFMNHLIMYYGYKCMNPNCIYELSQSNPISWDHVVPRSWGGLNTYANSQLLCKKCNSAKNAYNDNDYRTIPILTIEALDAFLLQYSISYYLSGDYLLTGASSFS